MKTVLIAVSTMILANYVTLTAAFAARGWGHGSWGGWGDGGWGRGGWGHGGWGRGGWGHGGWGRGGWGNDGWGRGGWGNDGWGHGWGNGGWGRPPHGVPEIDASAGLLALAAVGAALVLVWEVSRRRQA